MGFIKKSMLTGLSLLAAVTMGACSNTESTNFGLELENGNDYLVTSDLHNFTKQEVFEAMVLSQDNWGTSNGLMVLLDRVDYEVLSGQVEVDMTVIEEQMQAFRDANEDFEAFVLSNGFRHEDEIYQHLTLGALREGVQEKVEVSDDAIKSLYEEFAEENESEDFPELEEVWEEIETMLLQEGVNEELARLRKEAGFVLLDEYLHFQYEAFLLDLGLAVDGLVPELKETSTSIAARVGDIEITAVELNDTLLTFVGLSASLALLDSEILEDQFEVPDEDVTALINEFKIQLGAQFHPMMEQFYGLTTEQEIFDYFRLTLMQDEVFTSRYMPSEERLKELYEEYTIEGLSARHILVQTEEEALDLIAQLIEAEDVEALFIELAKEYGTDGTAEAGGDLGTFDLGVMVPEFESAVLMLGYSEFTLEPVQTDFGYHVIYRYEVEKGTFEELREQLLNDELERLHSASRVDAIFVSLREGINLAFTSEAMQQRYDLIVENILENLAMEDAFAEGNFDALEEFDFELEGYDLEDNVE